MNSFEKYKLPSSNNIQETGSQDQDLQWFSSAPLSKCWICSKHGVNEMHIQNFDPKNFKGRDH
jgi:hypothetical protein